MPFFHSSLDRARGRGGMTDVVAIIPDNYPIAFHVVEGSVHAVQSPSAYMGYRTFHSMGAKLHLRQTMPADDIQLVGHYIDHEIVAGIEADCAARLRRIRDGETRRFLLTMGGAGAQVRRFADIAETCKTAIEDKKVSLLINMGDHRGRWEELEKLFREKEFHGPCTPNGRIPGPLLTRARRPALPVCMYSSMKSFITRYTRPICSCGFAMS